MWALTSTMSANAGAIAGVNGDFGTGKGQPAHTLMIDGELWTSGQTQGQAAGWSSDGSRAYIGHPALRILASGASGPLFNIQQWNAHAPTATSIAAYTSRGGSVTQPPGKTNPTSTDPKWCAARLVPASPIAWSGAARTSLVRRYTVEAQPEPCERTPLGLGSKAGTVVVATKYTSSPNKVMALTAGDTVKLTTTLVGWPGVTDVMGGSQLLVDQGANVAPDYTPGADYILNYNPRTSVGISKGCSDTDNTTACRDVPHHDRRSPGEHELVQGRTTPVPRERADPSRRVDGAQLRRGRFDHDVGEEEGSRILPVESERWGLSAPASVGEHRRASHADGAHRAAVGRQRHAFRSAVDGRAQVTRTQTSPSRAPRWT